MNISNRILLVSLVLCLVSITGFSQETNSTPSKNETSDESSKSAGLRKIAGGSHFQDPDIYINIERAALESSVESSVEVAMEAVEAVLQDLEIHVAPIEINLGNLNMVIEPVVISIPELNFNMEPVEIDLGDMDINVDQQDFDWRNDNGEREKNKEKNKLKDKSDKSDKEVSDKSKGLKKIN